MGVFTKKPIQQLLQEAKSTGENTLKRTLSPITLIALGVGAIVGAGLFSITGIAAADYAGPGVIISFIIAGVACGLAGLCYAEFSSMIPIAGSAYTYSYATMGEFIAWVIGWDLVLEYSIAAALVAASWSGYLNELLALWGVALPQNLTTTPFDGGIMNLPAVFIVVVISLMLIRGTSQSARINNLIVLLKIIIVFAFIGIGFFYIRPENLTPFIPKNQGEFGAFGWSGVIRAAALVFFAYIGFDALSTIAQETKNPKKSMPIGILGTLIICTIIYILFAYVMTGVTNYANYSGNDLAPVATAIQWMGTVSYTANGTAILHPAFPWLNKAIIIAILLGYASVIIVTLLGQSRIFYSMSKDGLLPPIFSELHKKRRTPFKSNLIFMVFISLFAAFVPGRVVGEMTSIGTLFAFTLVCAGVLIMRYKIKDAPRSFKVPLMPYIPIAGILVCFGMMVALPFDTWIRLLVWMIIGLDIYISYGIKKSRLNKKHHEKKDKIIVCLIGLSIAILIVLMAIFHYYGTTIEKRYLQFFVISLIIGGGHILFFIFQWILLKKGRTSKKDIVE